MLYYWIHLIYIYVGSRFFWKKVDLGADLTRTRRVRVLDCEAMIHMSNSKYPFYMDFIRYEVMFRSNLFDHTMKKGIFAMLGSQKIIYRKPLKRWTKFDLTLKLEGWDDKWVYHRQVFSRNGEIHAVGFTRLTFLKDRETLSTFEILANCGIHREASAPSEEVLSMFDSDKEILRNT